MIRVSTTVGFTADMPVKIGGTHRGTVRASTR
jgi:hypothetical protein